MDSTSKFPVPSRGWLIFGGIISILVGFFAIAAPVIFSYILTELIGAFLLVGGLIGIGSAIFGSHTHHRVLSAFSGVIRTAAGAALFFFTLSGMVALTIILAAVFVAEGIVCILTSLKMRANPAWIWILLNGIVALILGGMVYARWPGDAAWIIGLLFGIQSIFGGTAFLMMGLATPKKTA